VKTVGSDRPDPTAALARLQPLVGGWAEEAADAPPGRMTFAWCLGGQFLLQRSEIPAPEFPDSLAVITVDPNGETYTQHYFDSRGVVRLYKMTIGDGTWTLQRDAPDFTPLEFSQRFVGVFGDGGDTITATWESAADGEHWEKDFDLVYRKVRDDRGADG
jgi:hypothetical protein